MMGQKLDSVANAQDRHAQFEDLEVKTRRVLPQHAGGAAGKHDGLRRKLADLVDTVIERLNFGVDVLLADAPRDQLGVLGAVVED